MIGLFVGVDIENAKRQLAAAGFLAGPLEGVFAAVRVVAAFEVVGVVLEPLEGVDLVEGHARLEDIDEGIAGVRDGFFEDFFGLVLVADEDAGDEGGIQRNSHGQRIERLGDDAVDLDGSDEAAAAGRRGLALGQTIDHVVVDDVGDFGVAADGVDKVVAPFAVHVAVAAFGDDGQLRVADLDGKGRRQRPAVQAIKGVAAEIMGDLGGLPDARDHD